MASFSTAETWCELGIGVCSTKVSVACRCDAMDIGLHCPWNTTRRQAPRVGRCTEATGSPVIARKVFASWNIEVTGLTSVFYSP